MSIGMRAAARPGSTVTEVTAPRAAQAEADSPLAPLLTCRLCGSSELRSFLDLGATPPRELFLTAAAPTTAL